MSRYKLDRTEESDIYSSLCFLGKECQSLIPLISGAEPA